MTGLANSGTFTLGDRQVNRIGYGAMQLAGPGVFGPPKDRAAALAVLREAVEAGTAFKKVETRGNAPVLKVGLGVVEEVPAQRDHRHNRDDLEEPRTHFGIAEAELKKKYQYLNS